MGYCVIGFIEWFEFSRRALNPQMFFGPKSYPKPQTQKHVPPGSENTEWSDAKHQKRWPSNPWTLPKSCHKPAKRLPKVSRQAANSLPKRFKTTRQILVANSVKTGAGTTLIPGGRKSLWHYIFQCFFTFRGPVLDYRFGIYRHPFWTPFWASRCSGLNVD